MEILLTKAADGTLRPLDEAQADLLKRYATDTLIRCEVKQVRNPRFHRKFFALLTLGFESWEPPILEYKGFEVQKDFEHFREDVTIAAGFYVVTTNLHGSVRLRAQSISFASMKQDEFERLYNAVANVLLQKVLTRYTRADLDQVINRVLGFCS
ncbi:DUF1367 family protein (plasmid) [Burkholderia vietnamiensis]|uniref:DUF1367 domain-containing protein n=1 Tax=Burkholderia vietnamiensis (strain G4 / LMG 22486) TaxID=269482 RepID=A4JWC0_BURVG|nr:protein of unknown function DUF1367 [Burkholderia vietnamiensis G4]MCB4349746.1 DUF1367 family protein [Burkholderia vietnamiensis]